MQIFFHFYLVKKKYLCIIVKLLPKLMEIRGNVDALIEYLKAEEDREVIRISLLTWRNTDHERVWQKGWDTANNFHISLARSKKNKIKNSILECDDQTISLKEFNKFYYGVKDEITEMYRHGDKAHRDAAVDVQTTMDNRLGDIRPDRRILFSKDKE